MYVVELSGEIMKIYNTEKLKYLKSLGFFVTDSYIKAVSYSNCLMNRGKDNRLYKYAKYF